MPEPKIIFATEMDKQKSQQQEISADNKGKIEGDRLEQLAQAFKGMTDTITSDFKSTGKKFFQIKPEEIEQKLTEENNKSLEEINKLSKEDKINVFRKAIALRSYKEDRDYDNKMCDDTVELINNMPNLSQKDKEKLLFAGDFVAIKNLGTETALNEFDKNGVP
nr:hypothetical protein [Ignavibacterium sp.]